MSVSLSMSFKMTRGSDEEFQAILNTLRRIGGSDRERWWGLHEETHSFTIGNSDFPDIWGENYLEADPEPYILFAKAAPKAEWNAKSERCDEMDGTTSEDVAVYAKGELSYEYADCFQRAMDYEELCEYVAENGFDEDGDDSEEGLTVEKLEECFEGIDMAVLQLFKKGRDPKKAKFRLEGDGEWLCLHTMAKDVYMITED